MLPLIPLLTLLPALPTNNRKRTYPTDKLLITNPKQRSTTLTSTFGKFEEMGKGSDSDILVLEPEKDVSEESEEVDSEGPPGFAEIDAFVGRFVDLLFC